MWVGHANRITFTRAPDVTPLKYENENADQFNQNLDDAVIGQGDWTQSWPRNWKEEKKN